MLSLIYPVPEFHASHSKFQDVLLNIKVAIINLPKPVRRVCYVQLFAFMGWWASLFSSLRSSAYVRFRFPFLFYSYVFSYVQSIAYHDLLVARHIWDKSWLTKIKKSLIRS